MKTTAGVTYTITIYGKAANIYDIDTSGKLVNPRTGNTIEVRNGVAYYNGKQLKPD